MELALYHPEFGYYANLPKTGWEGHYLTSAELDPSFGQLWARGIRMLWESCGRPRSFQVLELGAGEGGFAAAFLGALQADFAAALRYVIVEPLPALRTRQRTHLKGAPVEWFEALTHVPPVEIGCVFANEVLDNLPVDLVQQTRTGLVELRVTVNDERLALTETRPSGALKRSSARLARSIPIGHRTEVRGRDTPLMTEAAARLQSGALIFVDYGHEEEDLLAMPHGTLMCYSQTGVDDRPLERPGAKDITAHVNWTSLRRTCRRAGLQTRGPIRQHDVLTELGLDSLLAAARADRETATSTGHGIAAVRALSRHQALSALADPGGLGRLEVFAAFKDVAPPPFLDLR